MCAGGGDVACLAVGGGVIRPGVLNVGIGTAGHALAFAEGVSDAAFNRLWPMCHAVPGEYLWLGCSYTCGASMSWLNEQLGEDFETLTAQAGEVPPGSEGLFFMPWLEGAATPNPDAHARGGWVGLTLRHARGHLIRALMEGVAFDLRQSLECFKGLGLPAGGASHRRGGRKVGAVAADPGGCVRAGRTGAGSRGRFCAGRGDYRSCRGGDVYGFRVGVRPGGRSGRDGPVRCSAGAALRGVLPTL